MSRWSECRGQVEPLAALAAVAALGLALSVYTGTLGAAAPVSDPGGTAEPVLGATLDYLRSGSVVVPARLESLTDGHGDRSRRVRLQAAGRSWTAGPTPPADTAVATRLVAVRVAPGRIRVGRLRVEVWTP
ncbi:MAG: hypothetical protein ABEJ42_08165 [Halobacteriaceae archaeon]